MQAIVVTTKAVDRVRISVQVPNQLKRRLARLARARGISPSDIVRMTLLKYLPTEEAAA